MSDFVNKLGAPVDPFKQAADTFRNIKGSNPDVIFGATRITRDTIGVVVEDFSLAAQDQATYNTWSQIDTDLEKALRKYKSGLLALLQGMTTSGAVAAEVQSSTGTPGVDGSAPDLTANQL